MKHILNSVKYRAIELFCLFFVLPVLLATSLNKFIKLPMVLIAIVYVAYLLIIEKKWSTASISNIIIKQLRNRLITVSVLILILGTFILQLHEPSLLFKVPQTKPFLWITILFVYAFLSVLPQELVYRKFFYLRYESLFQNKKLFFCVNVLCFSLCHLFLKNFWVLLITLLGGILFTYTYEKTRSLKWVSLEHAIYGNLVFTIGLGDMLAFPS